MGVDTDVLRYQIPGGMISNLASQLADQDALELLPKMCIRDSFRNLLLIDIFAVTGKK